MFIMYKNNLIVHSHEESVYELKLFIKRNIKLKSIQGIHFEFVAWPITPNICNQYNL